QPPRPHGQAPLFGPQGGAAPARQNHEAAAASHGKSLPALGYCPIAPLMLQKTFATWLPRMISSTIPTTAIKTRISAYSTIPWPCSLRTPRQTRRKSPRINMPALSAVDLSQFVTPPLQVEIGPSHLRKRPALGTGLSVPGLPRFD